jgi:hypothetical protein
MKSYDDQLADYLAQKEAGTLAPYDDQVKDAIASGRLYRTNYDFNIGQFVVIYWTDEEIAAQPAIDAAVAAEIAARPPDPIAVLTQQVQDLQTALLTKQVIQTADLSAAAVSLEAQPVKMP